MLRIREVEKVVRSSFWSLRYARVVYNVTMTKSCRSSHIHACFRVYLLRACEASCLTISACQHSCLLKKAGTGVMCVMTTVS